jgi:hypothetical protein
MSCAAIICILSLLRADIQARILDYQRVIDDMTHVADFGLYRLPLPRHGYYCDHCTTPIATATLSTTNATAQWLCDDDRGCQVHTRECNPSRDTNGLTIAMKCNRRQGCVERDLSDDIWNIASRDISDESLIANKGYTPAHSVADTKRYPTSSQHNLATGTSYLHRVSNNNTTPNANTPLSPSNGETASLQRAPPRYSWTKQNLVRGSVAVKYWTPDEPFVEWLINHDQPVILRRTIVDHWPARTQWTPSYLFKHIGVDQMIGVKHASDYTLFDVDHGQPMSRLPHIHVGTGYTHINMSVHDFFTKIVAPEDGHAYYHFGAVPHTLKADLLPDDFMYADLYDLTSREHFAWISSRGPRMHTHFDQDRNVFVQIYGEKLFTLFPPSSSDDMYMFPRLHPLWHKSQVHFDEPDLEKFPHYRRAEAYEAHLYPGDGKTYH